MYTLSSAVQDSSEESEDSDDDVIVVCEAACCPRIRSTPPTPPEGADKTCWSMFVYGLKWFLYIIAFPFYFMCTFTIPDCSKEHNRLVRSEQVGPNSVRIYTEFNSATWLRLV